MAQSKKKIRLQKAKQARKDEHAMRNIGPSFGEQAMQTGAGFDFGPFAGQGFVIVISNGMINANDNIFGGDFEDDLDDPSRLDLPTHQFTNTHYNMTVYVSHNELADFYFPLQEQIEQVVPALADQPNAISFSVDPVDAINIPMPIPLKSKIMDALDDNLDSIELGRGVCFTSTDTDHQDVYVFVPPCRLSAKAYEGNLFRENGEQIKPIAVARLVSAIDADLARQPPQQNGPFVTHIIH